MLSNYRVLRAAEKILLYHLQKLLASGKNDVWEVTCISDATWDIILQTNDVKTKLISEGSLWSDYREVTK